MPAKHSNPKTICSIKKELIVKLDGNQHLKQEDYDRERSDYLESKNYKVIRFWNNDVLNDLQGVLRVIDVTLRGD